MAPKTKKPIASFYLTLTPHLGEYLKQRLKQYDVRLSGQPLDIRDIDKDTEIVGVFVDSPITDALIKQLPKLKLIVTLSTGYDHIDIKAAKKRNIPVCNVPHYGEHTVAEFTIGLILALSRKLFQGVKRVKEGGFDYHDLRGFDLKDKTVGIIGAGHIGLHVMEILSGFGVHLLAYDPFPKKELATEYHFSYVSLPMLVKESDIISLHAPLTPSTRHIINKKVVQKMKPGVSIINTSRGGLVESESIVWGLEQGIISGAALDVLEGEDLLKERTAIEYSALSPKDMRIILMNEALIAHPNTIVTPHNAFNSQEAVQRIIDTTIDTIFAAERGTLQYDVT